MSKESSYELLQVKKWRAITYNWDVLSTYGNTTNLYCLTDFQAAWLLSNTQYMRWTSRWSNCPCTSEDLDAMAAELEYNLMNCFDTSWIPQMQYVYQRANDQQLTEFELAYDADGIAGINENTPTDFYNGDDSTNRQKALCMACETYVKSIITQWSNQLRAAQFALQFAGFIVYEVPYVGLIAGIVVEALAIATQVAIDAANDQDAIEEVVCCMFNGLYEQAVNQANFEICLDGCGFDPGSNAAIVRDIIAADIDQDKNWYSFLNALGNAWIYLQAGVDYTCACVPETTFSHYFDFTLDNGGFTRVTSGVGSGTAGVWTAGTGWVATNTFYPSSTYRKIVYLQRTFDARTITKILVTFDLTKGSWSNPAEFIIADRATGLPSADITYAASANGNGQTVELNGSANISSFTLRHLSSLASSNSYSGSAIIKSVYIEGIGSDPFV